MKKISLSVRTIQSPETVYKICERSLNFECIRRIPTAMLDRKVILNNVGVNFLKKFTSNYLKHLTTVTPNTGYTIEYEMMFIDMNAKLIHISFCCICK